MNKENKEKIIKTSDEYFELAKKEIKEDACTLKDIHEVMIKLALNDGYNQGLIDAVKNAKLNCGNRGIKKTYLADNKQRAEEYGSTWITIDKKSILKLKNNIL